MWGVKASVHTPMRPSDTYEAGKTHYYEVLSHTTMKTHYSQALRETPMLQAGRDEEEAARACLSNTEAGPEEAEEAVKHSAKVASRSGSGYRALGLGVLRPIKELSKALKRGYSSSSSSLAASSSSLAPAPAGSKSFSSPASIQVD